MVSIVFMWQLNTIHWKVNPFLLESVLDPAVFLCLVSALVLVCKAHSFSAIVFSVVLGSTVNREQWSCCQWVPQTFPGGSLCAPTIVYNCVGLYFQWRFLKSARSERRGCLSSFLHTCTALHIQSHARVPGICQRFLEPSV